MNKPIFCRNSPSFQHCLTLLFSVDLENETCHLNGGVEAATPFTIGHPNFSVDLCNRSPHRKLQKALHLRPRPSPCFFKSLHYSFRNNHRPEELSSYPLQFTLH